MGSENTVATEGVRLPVKEEKRVKMPQIVLGPYLLGGIVPFLLIVVWELLSRFGFVAVHLLPAPTAILTSIVDMAMNGAFSLLDFFEQAGYF